MYDPFIGRFISADTIVPDFTNPQSLNRYSYVLNNPLIYVDPSGYWIVQAAGATIGAGVNAAKNYGAYSRGEMSLSQYSRSISVGAATGFLASFGAGPLAGALLGGSTAAINEMHEQTLEGKDITNYNYGKVGTAGKSGVGVGAFAGALQKGAGLYNFKPSNVIGNKVQTQITKFSSLAPRAGIAGNVAGTITANFQD